MAQPHRRWLKEEKALDQRAESALGRLYLAGLISQPECWAGERFKTLLQEFHVILASPVTISSAAIMVATSLEAPAEAEYLGSEVRETEEDKRERVLAQFEQAKRALAKVRDPKRASAALDALMWHDCASDDLGPVHDALKCLARLWRMEEPAEKEQDRPINVKGCLIGNKAVWSFDEKEVVIHYK